MDQEFTVTESVDGGKSWDELPLRLGFLSRVKNFFYKAWPPRKVVDGWYLGADRLCLLLEGRPANEKNSGYDFLATFSQRSGRWSVSMVVPNDDEPAEPDGDGDDVDVSRA